MVRELIIKKGNKQVTLMDKDDVTSALSGKASTATATESSHGLMDKDDKKKLNGISTQANKTTFTQTIKTGTEIGTVTVDGVGTKIYQNPVPTVENNLSSNSTSNALSAKQGKELNEKIANIVSGSQPITQTYVDIIHPGDTIEDGCHIYTDSNDNEYSLTLSATKDIIVKDEVTTISALLKKNNIVLSNEDIEFIVNNKSIYATTDDNGVASFSYTGNSVGKLNIDVNYCNFLQETFVLTDASWYDKGILNDPQTNDNWTNYSSTATLTRTATHSVLKETGSSNTIARIGSSSSTEYKFNGDYCLELDLKQVDGGYSNTIVDIRNYADSTAFNPLTLTNMGVSDHDWHHIKIRITETTIYAQADDNNEYTRSRTITSDYRLGLWGGGDITELHFKNVRVYPI